MDRPSDFAHLTTQTQPEMGGTGGGGKTRNGLFDGGASDDSAPGALTNRFLSPRDVIPILRELEHCALSDGTKSAIVYWSTHTAGRLLPTGPVFRDLMKTAHCVSVFSEDISTLPDVSIVCVFSEKGCAFIEMHRIPNTDSYKCFGSVNAERTVARMKVLFDRFRSHDLVETNRLVARLELLPFKRTNSVFNAIYSMWKGLPYAPEPWP